MLDSTHQFLFVLFSLGGLSCCAFFGFSEYLERKGQAQPHTVICKDGSCLRLSHTRYAKIFGVPNWWFGTAFYLITLFGAVLNQPDTFTWLYWASAASILMSVALIYGLVFRLKTFCTACYTSHFFNLCIFLTWILFLQ